MQPNYSIPCLFSTKDCCNFQAMQQIEKFENCVQHPVDNSNSTAMTSKRKGEYSIPLHPGGIPDGIFCLAKKLQGKETNK